MNVLLLGLAAAAGFAAPPQCVVQPSTTVAHTDHSRVVYVRKNEERTGLQRIYYGCYGRHRRRLGVRGCFPDFCDLEQFRLAGPMVAFAEVYAGRGDPAFDIHVRNLRTGRVVRDVPAASHGLPDYDVRDFGVKDLEVTRRGAAAWIIVNPFAQPTRPEVYVADAERRRRVDAGPEIGLRSLRIEGAVARWRHGAERRSVRLRCCGRGSRRRTERRARSGRPHSATRTALAAARPDRGSRASPPAAGRPV